MNQDLSLFHRVIEEQIERVRNKQSIETDIGILEDLKRMGDLGCFTVYTKLEPPKVDIEGDNLNVSAVIPRIMWTGEQELSNQIAKNKVLEDKIKKLEFMIDNGLGWEDLKNDINYPPRD